MVGSVAGPGARGDKDPGAGSPPSRANEKGEHSPSLQRFTRYPGSDGSIRPLALPTGLWYESSLKSYEEMLFNIF